MARQNVGVRDSDTADRDLIVIMSLNGFTCAECGEELLNGHFLTMTDEGPLCMSCADLDHLVFLESGNAALSRRSKKASALSALVMRFSRSRKRYERQGILVEEKALEQAEAQCLDDLEVRARKAERSRERASHADAVLRNTWSKEIQRLFPGCDRERAESIAKHAVERGSNRPLCQIVNCRSAAGRAIDENSITLAMVASIRHNETEYDDLLMSA